MITKNLKYLICMFYVTEIYSYTRIFYYRGSIDKEFILLCLMNEAFKYVDEAYSDTAIVIHTPRLTPDTEKLISLIRMLNMQIAVKRDGETHLLDTEKILYIEAVERSTFVYTEDATYGIILLLFVLFGLTIGDSVKNTLPCALLAAMAFPSQRSCSFFSGCDHFPCSDHFPH